MPTFSIIIVCYDNEKELTKTLKSINSNLVEIIVIDGSSSNKIKQLCKESLLEIKLISEPDLGIYDAMNKGIQHSSGTHMIFMNSGDYFANNSLNTCLDLKMDEEKTYYGNAEFHKNNEKVFSFTSSMHQKHNFLKHNCFSHQAIFYSHKHLKKITSYNLSYTISADFDLTWRIFIYDPKSFHKLDLTIAICDLGGISCQKGIQSYQDRMKVFYNTGHYLYMLILAINFPIFYIKNKTVKLLEGSKLLNLYRKLKSRI